MTLCNSISYINIWHSLSSTGKADENTPKVCGMLPILILQLIYYNITYFDLI